MRALRMILTLLPVVLRGQPPLPTVPVRDFVVPWGREGRPRDPAVAPDGKIFFVGQEGNYIARLDPASGAFKRYDIDPGTHPHNCIVDAAGNVWFSGNRKGMIGRLDPATGALTRFPIPDTTVKDPHTMVFDRKGNIWFTAQGSNAVGYLDVGTGKFRIVKIPLPAGRRSTNPYGIALDSKGRPWFNLFATNMIGTLDPLTFELKTYALVSDKTRDRRIAITSDDKIWYDDYTRGYLGRLDPLTAKAEEWPLPGGAASLPYGMTVDDRDRIWMAESNPSKANRLVGFDTKTKSFFSVTELKGELNTVRYMTFDRKTKMIWFGSDAGFIGRADVSGLRTAM